MKLSSLLLASLTLATSASAQYFSEGWNPDQAATEQAPPPAYTAPSAQSQPPAPEQKGPSLSPFDVTRLLQAGPVASLFNKIGVNITQQLETARLRASQMWDGRIPLITDDNFEELIVNEDLTPEEEEKRVWFLVITAQAAQASGMSKFLDDNFDIAFNTSLIENDLPYVRWGRIDYINVTYITTKWGIWQAPYVVVAKDRGKTLYFYKANQVRLTPDIMRDFLKQENWKNNEPWTSPFAPGGSNEYLLHYFALASQKIYDIMVIVPKWVLMIASGALASLVMRFMHKNPEAEVAYKDRKPESAPAPKPVAAEKPTTTASPVKPKSGGAKLRKGKK